MKREYTDEELLREAGEILAEERLAEFERRMEEEHRFSPRFERRRKKLLGESSGPRTAAGRRWSVRTAAILAALAFLSVAAIAAGPVYERISRTRTAIGRLDDGRVEVTAERIENDERIETGREPTYLPEGYEELYREGDRHIYYACPNENRSVIDFERVPFEEGTVFYDEAGGLLAERTEPVPVGPYDGLILYIDASEENVGESANVIWWDSVFMYRVSAFVTDPPDSSAYIRPTVPLPTEELLKVARSAAGDPGCE